VSAAIERELWDGAWYLRGFTKAGVPIGSHASPEGKVFLEHMPWAVIAGVAAPERGIAALDAVHDHLASEYGTHLVWPSYTKVDDSIGYVTRVYPGVKENGAIFSHPNAWPIIAEALLGRGERAYEYYRALAPSRYNDRIEIRRTEPYVYAQFVYGRDHELFGRAENPWLTGTAGWTYTAATQYLLGIRPTLNGLVIDPCIPAEWDGFEVTRQWRGATYHIKVRNPNHLNCATARPLALHPIAPPGTTVEVELVLN
jgi:N,N'-diacetylchitobiose phosphorylase